MKNKALTPKIRYTGYVRDWATYSLGELGFLKNGMNFGKEAMGHGFPFVNLMNVFGRPEVDHATLELAESTSSQRKDYSLLKGDVLFVRSSVKPEGVGEAALVTSDLIDTTYSGFLIRFRSSNLLSELFNRVVYQTSRVRCQIVSSASRSANTNISQDSLNSVVLIVPEIQEQQKIGTFFKELDRLIELHQCKHDKLSTLKQAMLQKMFPQAGASVPEVRFKDFSEKWHSVTLGELGDFYRGISYASHNVRKSGLLVLRSTNIQEYCLIFNRDLQFIDLECPENLRLRKNDVAICMSNGSKSLVGKSASCDDEPTIETTVGAFCSIFRSNEKASKYLLQTQRYWSYLNELLAGSSINNLKNSDLSGMSFFLPKEQAERDLIAKYFSSLDKSIGLHAAQLQKLKQLKSAFLEKMFV